MSEAELQTLIDKCMIIYEIACWSGIDKKVLNEEEGE